MHSPTRSCTTIWSFSWCGAVSQPDIIAEIADFFIRFDKVNWSLAAGLFDGQLKFSLRAGLLGGRAGETLSCVVNGIGTAGGHDRRAGGAIVLADTRLGNRRYSAEHDPPSTARPAPYRRAARTPALERLHDHSTTLSRFAKDGLSIRCRRWNPTADGQAYACGFLYSCVPASSELPRSRGACAVSYCGRV